MTAATELFALQEIDLAMDRARARLQEIDEGVQETEELAEARQLKIEKEEVLSGLRAKQRELEWEVDQVRSKASEMEAKLYGGTVRNPKELSDLDTDVRALKAQASKREDVLLALMEEAETAEGEWRAAETEYSRIEADWSANRKVLLDEKAELEPEVQRLQLQRTEQLSEIDRASLRLYEILRERRAGHAVARVEQGMCQGCRITLPMSVLQKTRTGAGLVQCVSCERILLVG
jgi:predicted  nucleic acid-binding Zn-ribbon protein